MATVFITGFPGFLGSQLLPRILARRQADHALCLVQSKYRQMAERRTEELTAEHPGLEGRVKLVEGDITMPCLGLGNSQILREDIVEIYHLAAIYDLGVGRYLGMKINVDGTRHVLDYAADCSCLARFHYMSTCYVSGRYCGPFGENELDKGQKFNNYYEETKFLAEVEVQARMRAGLPVTIYRPSIVTGDSHSGATQKYDGPYFVVQWLLRQPRFLAVLPMVGDPAMARVNLVPRDFVTDAIAYLSGLEQSLGKVYQLADPDPLTVDSLVTEVGRATERNVLRIPLPLRLAKFSLRHVKPLAALMRIPADVVDYFVHPTHYLTYNTEADLEGSGIQVPHLTTYLHRLVDFLKKNPEAGLGVLS